MSSWNVKQFSCRCILLMCCLFPGSIRGQLQLSEVMYNSVNEGSWEWIEVRNPTGVAIDLDGSVLDDDDNNALTAPNIVSTGSGGMATSTIVPANGVAVLYNGTSLGFDNQRFRNAWQLGAGIPLIAVASPPDLSNTADHFGLWTSLANYNLDLANIDADPDLEVAQFTNSTVNLGYGTGTGFPSGTDRSIYWNGAGSSDDGANWFASADGVDGATTSIATFLSGAQANDTRDVANPGVIASGSVPSGLVISEIMYNPRSSEPGWEWVELVNNSGSTIDFAATPYTFDEGTNNPALTAPNITSGSIPQGGIAILFNGSAITQQNMRDAWGAGLNYIPVANWSQTTLNNDNYDTVALWDDFAEYELDNQAGPGVFANAVVSVTYNGSAANGFPADDGNGSIHRSPIDADPTLGTSWQLSFAGDTLSFNASPALDTLPDHSGGDQGSPGHFGTSTGVDADFNDDGNYDCADIDSLVAAIVGGANPALFDLTGDGQVNLADRDAWLSEAGNQVLGAGRAYLLGDANLNGAVDGSDFGIWNANKFTASAAWCLADFNASGAVDGSDFGIWNANKFQSSDAAAAVPEPAGLLLGFVTLILGASGWRKNSWENAR